jgi:hypothetical protein
MGEEKGFLRLEVFTEVTMKNAIFWDVKAMWLF